MSSGFSGRYQSRLFNFVHQQSRRVTQQWEHTFRHLQVATKWGVEVLLYPVYLLFQSSESSGKTLQTQEPQTRLKLQPNDTDFSPETLPNVDTPIQEVLQTVNYLLSDEAVSTPIKTSEPFNALALLEVLRLKFVSNNASLTQPSNIVENQAASINSLQLDNVPKHQFTVMRGIATNLMNRHLVLVTGENEILDILTPQQQAKLEEIIINEIASYWQSWRLMSAKKEAELLPQIDRLLAKLTDKNPAKIPVLAEVTSTDLLNTHRLLSFLDIAVAKLESNALVPVQERSQEIVQVAQTQLNIFLYGKEQLAARGEIINNADGLETHPLNLQALIEAALNYFFGAGNRKLLEPTISDEQLAGKLLSSHPKKALSESPLLENQDLGIDPWLTWSDLFGKTETVADESEKLSQPKNPALAASLSAVNILPKNLTLKQPKIGSGLLRREQITTNLTSNKKTSGKVASTKKNQDAIYPIKNEALKGDLQQQSHQSSQVEAQPDWIETKAISTGYEKHPLEQILQWLDYVILWLEERFVRIFQSLRQLWQGK